MGGFIWLSTNPIATCVPSRRVAMEYANLWHLLLTHNIDRCMSNGNKCALARRRDTMAPLSVVIAKSQTSYLHVHLHWLVECKHFDLTHAGLRRGTSLVNLGLHQSQDDVPPDLPTTLPFCRHCSLNRRGLSYTGLDFFRLMTTFPLIIFL